MRKPTFMEGTSPIAVEALKLAIVDPARIRHVSWAAPIEPAMPKLAVTPVAEAPPAPASAPVSVGAHFEPLPSHPVEPATTPAFSPEAEQRLHLALVTLKAQGERLAEQARSDSLELGILIARRILERELSTNLESVFSLIKSAIRRAGEDHVTRIRLAPADLARFEADTTTEFSFGKIELSADASLQSGDVMVDTDSHTIDGRLATQFTELVRQLDGSP